MSRAQRSVFLTYMQPNECLSSHPHPKRAFNQFSGQWTTSILYTLAVLFLNFPSIPIEQSKPRNGELCFPKAQRMLSEAVKVKYSLNQEENRCSENQIHSIHPCMHTVHRENVMGGLMSSSRNINTSTLYYTPNLYLNCTHTPSACVHKCTLTWLCILSLLCNKCSGRFAFIRERERQC